MSHLDNIILPPSFNGVEWDSSKIDEFDKKHPPFYLKIKNPPQMREMREFVKQRYVNKDMKKTDIILDLNNQYISYKANKKPKLR